MYNNVMIFRHIEVTTGPSQSFVFSIRFYNGVESGTVGFSAPQRKWATLSINQVSDSYTSIVHLATGGMLSDIC